MFVILIGDYTWRQLSADASNPAKDRIFLLGTKDSFFSWPEPTHEIGKMFPEIEQTCCVIPHSGTITSGDISYKDEGRAIIEIADPDFFDFFDYRFISGDRASAIDAPDKCVITESLANYLFPAGEAMGQTLNIADSRSVYIQGDDPYDATLSYTVSGVIKDLDKTVLPNRTKIIVNAERAPQVLVYTRSNTVYAYGPFGGTASFLMLKEGTDLSPKLPLINDHLRK